MIDTIIFDFDGVVLDSVPVKTEAFRKLFKPFPSYLVDQFIAYHELNGGISRYVKIKYFFEQLLNQTISETDINSYASKYSELTLLELTNPKYIIQETFELIVSCHKNKKLHIASGADQIDLKFICEKLNLTQYFKSIHGSPKPKYLIIEELLQHHQYALNSTCLIGDSINDFEAAKKNGILFFGYNNLGLQMKGSYYLNTMKNLLSFL